MATAEELMNALEPEGHIVVGNDRHITIPNSLKRIAVQFDHNIETVTFDCPRYWDGVDMSTMAIYVNYKRSDGYEDSNVVSNIRIDEADENIMHFDWTITRNVTMVKGPITMSICIKETDEVGNELRHWNSELNKEMVVSEGLECGEQIAEEHPDVITYILNQLSNSGGDGSNITVDDALSETSTNPVQNKVVTEQINIIRGIDKTENGNYLTIDAIDNSKIEIETEAEKVSYCGNNLLTIDNLVYMSFANINTAIYASQAKCIIVRCKPNTTYSVKKFEDLGSVFRVISTAEKPTIGMKPLSYNEGTTEIQVTTPNNANWLAVMVANSAYKADQIENVLNVTMCVESDEMPTVYEPFVGGTVDVVDGKCNIVENDTMNIFTESADDMLKVTYKTPIAETVNVLNEKMAEIENQEYWKKQRMRFCDEPVKVAYSDGGGLGYINTLSAYIGAGIAGYKWLKGDIQPTSDGKLIMCHDNGFTFNADGYITAFDANNCTMIHTLTYNEVMSKEYTAWYSGYRMKVCDIEDYLKVCRDFNMRPYITIRDDYMDIVVPELLSMLEKYNFTDHCIVNSFNKGSLRLVAEKSNHRVMISNVKYYNVEGQITVDDIKAVLDISPNCTICPYCNNAGYNIPLYENSSEALEYAKENNIMLGTCAITKSSPSQYYKFGINLFQCYQTWIDTKVTSIMLNLVLTDGIATLTTTGAYSDRYTATVTQVGNVITLSDVKLVGSDRYYPDGIAPHLRGTFPWSCNTQSSIVKSCNYTTSGTIEITLYDGVTDGQIIVKFIYGI